MNRGFLVLSAALLLSAGCTSVPKNASVLGSSVTLGIARMQEQTESIIHALGDIEREVLSERWEEIYRRSEAEVRRREKLGAEATLSEDQRIDSATVAAATRDRLLGAIAVKEAELIQATRGNADRVIEINETVRRYLLSLEDLESARGAARARIEAVSGVDVRGLAGLAVRLLGSGESAGP